MISCGGRTRTNDLYLVRVASYQLLHTAILVGIFLSTLPTEGKELWDYAPAVLVYGFTILPVLGFKTLALYFIIMPSAVL